MLKRTPEDPDKTALPGNRIRLPEESGIRDLAGFKQFLAMAESSKGSQIELSWTTKVQGQRYVLDMQWDSHQKAPFWTLYEENNGKSERLWDEPFTIANVDMCYDVLVMTCGGVAPTTKNLAEILKAQPEKMDWSKPVAKPESNTPAPPAQAAPAAPAAPVAAPVVPNNLPPNMGQNPGFPPGYMYPPGMPPGMGFPMPPQYLPPNAQMPPNSQMPGMPMAAPAYPQQDVNSTNGNFPPQQGMPPGNAWQYGAPPGGVNYFGQPNAAPAPQNMPNMSMQNVPMQRTGTGNNLGALPVDSALLNKQQDMALVDLLVRADLITEISLAAAIKVQELIRQGLLDGARAAEILKTHHNKGQTIGNYLNAPAAETSAASLSDESENSAAFDLLTQAGLLSKDDIQLARAVIKKHGGEILSILQAAQKLDIKTFEAAKICCALHNDGLMKLEQSVIVLNYCSRSRVSFDEALNELKWPNPRQQFAQ